MDALPASKYPHTTTAELPSIIAKPGHHQPVSPQHIVQFERIERGIFLIGPYGIAHFSLPSIASELMNRLDTVSLAQQ